MQKFLLLTLFSFIIIGSEAQILEKVKTLDVLYTRGIFIPTYYSRSYGTKASKLQAMLDKCVGYFHRKLHTTIDSLYLTVFNDIDFAKLNISKPYGLPFVDGIPPVVFLPANSSGIVAVQTKHLLANSNSLKNITKITSYDMTTAIDKSIDLIGFHEIGHLYSNKMHIQQKLDEIFWFKEFVASYFAYSYLQENEVLSAQLWTLMSDAILKSWAPENKKLEEMGKVSIADPKAYSWYQAKMITKVALVYKSQKLSFIKRLQKFCSTHNLIDKQQLLIELSRTIKDVKEW